MSYTLYPFDLLSAIVCFRSNLIASWEYVDDWSACSATCDGGTQTRTQSCVYSDKTAAEGPCSGDVKSETRKCNIDPCRKLYR